MTRKATIPIVSAVLLAAWATAAAAQGIDRDDRYYGTIQAERERQRMVIENGRSDGSLTFLERYALRREQARIDQLEREALADGRLSRDEYRLIRRAQDDAARHIHVERHDAEVRGWWWRLWR